MPAIALRRRSQEQVEDLVRKDFERYRGRIIFVYYAVDYRRLGRVNVSFVPPLRARVTMKAPAIEWDSTYNYCDVSYEIMPLDLDHPDLAGMDWLHVNAPGRSANPALDEYWLNHWSLAKRKFGVVGGWTPVLREEAITA